jgi:hypothetical protein
LNEETFTQIRTEELRLQCPNARKGRVCVGRSPSIGLDFMQ